MFTMHGTTMVFFVGMPILFGFANYLVPLMIGARDMAFPRLNAFSFWITAVRRRCSSTSASSAARGSTAAGSAPDVGWFAYAPLTAQAFSPRPQHRLLDARPLRQRASARIGTAVNIVTTILCHALPGHDARQACRSSSG